MKSFRRIVKLILPQKKYLFLNIFFNIIQIVAGLFTIFLMMPFLNLMFNQETPISSPKKDLIQNIFNNLFNYLQNLANHNSYKVLMYVSLILVVVTLIKNISRYLALFFFAILRSKVINSIRQKVYDKLLKLPISYFTNERKGDLMSRMSNDVKEVEWSLNASLEALYKEPVMIFFYLTSLILMSVKLTLFVLFLLPLSVGSIALIGKSIRRKSKQNNESQANLLSFLEESLGGIKSIKSFVVENIFFKKFNILNTKATTHNIKVNQRGDLASPISETLGISAAALILLFGGNMVLKGEIQASVFITYFGVFSQLINPFKILSQSFPLMQRGAASLDRFDEILNAEEKIVNQENPTILSNFKDKIEFKNVSFYYGDKLILDNINLNINKGEKVALVGGSGGGKSTIADLVPRFHDVAKGEILIDGINIKNIEVNSLRQNIGLVSQEPFLFNDSVKNNILFGQENIEEYQIIEACKNANAWDFVSQLENGLDTIIGERGNKLSGGQKQRIVIARALLKNPPILILDEATSALDNESEKIVQNALDVIEKGRTTITIAHRLSTIVNADMIYVLEKGKIVEHGNHQQLMSKNGYYFNLYQSNLSVK